MQKFIFMCKLDYISVAINKAQLEDRHVDVPSCNFFLFFLGIEKHRLSFLHRFKVVLQLRIENSKDARLKAPLIESEWRRIEIAIEVNTCCSLIR